MHSYDEFILECICKIALQPINRDKKIRFIRLMNEI